MSDNVKAWEAYEKAVAKTQSRSVDQKERISKMDDALKKLSYKDLKELGVSISDDAIIQETKAFKKTFEVAMGEFSSAITVEANNLVLTYLKHVAKKRLSKLRELKKVEEDAQSKGSKWGSYEVFEEDVHSDEGTSAKEREARKVLESHYNSFKSKLEKTYSLH